MMNSVQVANDTIHNLVPETSQNKYKSVYKNFMDWCSGKNYKSFTENVLLAYFTEMSNKYKSSSLWTFYSMLRSTLNINNGINIKDYLKLRAFLKRKSEKHIAKKAKTFTLEQLNNFINEAPDDKYLATKVALIMGVMGACRAAELHSMQITDLEDHGCSFLVCVPNTKTKIARKFTITGNFYTIVKKYLNLRPRDTSQTILFFRLQNGKYHSQRIGINKFGAMGKDIAIFLKLPDSNLYTGHCFRRSSATLLVDADGGDITAPKCHGGWRSTTVAEGLQPSTSTTAPPTTDRLIKLEEPSCSRIQEPCIDTTLEFLPETSEQPVVNVAAKSKSTYKGAKDRIYCRLCLKISNKNSLTPLNMVDFNYPGKSDAFKKKKAEKVEEIHKMIKFCLPFFDPLTFNPIICSICLARLRSSYDFANECLKNQRLIEKYADIYDTTERVININEMIESKFSLSDDESDDSDTDTEDTTASIPKVTRSSTKVSQQTRGEEHLQEDGPATKKMKIYNESEEENSMISSNDTLNIKTEPYEDDGFASKEFLTQDIRIKDIDQDNMDNITDESMIKVEPEYIDSPDFMKTEPVDDLHVENEVFNKKTGIGTDIQEQHSHFPKMENVASDAETNVPSFTREPVFSNVDSNLEATTSDVN